MILNHGNDGNRKDVKITLVTSTLIFPNITFFHSIEFWCMYVIIVKL